MNENMDTIQTATTLSTRERVTPSDIEWGKCFICQETKYPKKNKKLSKATPDGSVRLLECASQREKFNDIKYLDTLDRLKIVDLKACEKDSLWHRSCYSDFTNQGHIDRLKKRCPGDIPPASTVEGNTSAGETSTERCSRRSVESSVDWEVCIFCQAHIAGVKLNQVQTLRTSARILKCAENDRLLGCRFTGIHDLIAAEGKYHLKCYSKFLRDHSRQDSSDDQETSPHVICFDSIMTDLRRDIARGHVYSLRTIWSKYTDLFSDFDIEPDVYRSNKFKERIQNQLRDQVSFVQPLNPTESQLIIPSELANVALHSTVADLLDGEARQQIRTDNISREVDYENEMLSWLFRVAVKVHSDIKHITGHEYIGGIDVHHAKAVIPESLYLFIRLLCEGEMALEEDSETGNRVRGRILSICQDIVYMVSDGRKLTPKHIGLALTVHQATRSKELIQLLHAAGHCVSYDTVRRIDNSIANDTLKSYRDHGEIFIPRNFTPSSNLGYVRFSDDNIDINEETLSGMGTFHATQYAALRRKAPQEPTAQMQIELSSSRVLDLKVPSELHELQDAHMSTDNPEPTFQLTIPHAFYEPDKEQIKKTISLDMAWILSRQVNPDNQVIPGWSGFNQHIVKNNPPETEIHPLPIINAPAHDFDAIWTVMKRTEATTKQLQEKYTIITFDEQLYSKAKMLQWAKADNCEDFVIMLGGFHTQMNFSKVIGQYMESSGLTDIWVKSGIYGENTAENILKGKIWNRVIRAHMLTVDALWRILWPHFTLWVEQNGKVMDEKLIEFTSEIAEGFMQNDNDMIEASLDRFLCRVEQATALLEEFDKERCDNATFKYWRTYMHMVAILLRFTRAIRDGDWLLYLSAFAEMLPWFAAFDHVNYFRWGAIFLADMKLLQHTAPEVYQGFLNDDFVTKETSSKFNQISDAQALEHVNRVGKIAGGLIGITRTDSARDRWCLTYSDYQKAPRQFLGYQMLPMKMKRHSTRTLAQST